MSGMVNNIDVQFNIAYLGTIILINHCCDWIEMLSLNKLNSETI
jgi:hypothetical protein